MNKHTRTMAGSLHSMSRLEGQAEAPQARPVSLVPKLKFELSPSTSGTHFLSLTLAAATVTLMLTYGLWFMAAFLTIDRLGLMQNLGTR